MIGRQSQPPSDRRGAFRQGLDRIGQIVRAGHCLVARVGADLAGTTVSSRHDLAAVIGGMNPEPIC